MGRRRHAAPRAQGDRPGDHFLQSVRRDVRRRGVEDQRGGALCCWQAALPAGAYDQREIESRSDVLVYTTPPLESEVEVTGPIECHLWAARTATSNVFKAGHRIRVEVSSSNFPRFDRNPNTGGAIGRDAEMQSARQTIVHDAEHPSHIVLPILPR